MRASVTTTGLAALMLSSCNSGGPVEADFCGYASWHCVSLGNAPLAGHPAGARVACINQVPPSTATSYPVGTIIVKEIHSDPDPQNWEIFAMYQHGGDYNAGGAQGWEFFLMRPGANGCPTITDRGVAPSAGDPYASANSSGCNGCHGTAAAAATDYVLDAPLRLGQ